VITGPLTSLKKEGGELPRFEKGGVLGGGIVKKVTGRGMRPETGASCLGCYVGENTSNWMGWPTGKTTLKRDETARKEERKNKNRSIKQGRGNEK